MTGCGAGGPTGASWDRGSTGALPFSFDEVFVLARATGALLATGFGSDAFTTSEEEAALLSVFFRAAVFLGAGSAAGLALALGFATFFAVGNVAAATVVDVSSVMSGWGKRLFTPANRRSLKAWGIRSRKADHYVVGDFKIGVNVLSVFVIVEHIVELQNLPCDLDIRDGHRGARNVSELG